MKRLSLLWLLLLAALLAFMLQGFIRDALILPGVYLLWRLSLYLRTIPQSAYWALLVGGLALVALTGLFRRLHFARRTEMKRARQQGPVERLAGLISNAHDSVYVKWMVANRLGRVAQTILDQREGQGTFPQRALSGPEWKAPEQVQAYLEAGLNRSFTGLPRRKFFSRPPPTPFDVDINGVVAFLESQMERRSGS